MALTGKYNFKGIKRLGAAGLRGALLSSPWTAWLIRVPNFTNFVLEAISNWLANKGLVILNLGAIYIEGEFDQAAWDKAMDNALGEIQLKGGREKLTPEQIKEIDDEIIRKARRFVLVSKPPK